MWVNKEQWRELHREVARLQSRLDSLEGKGLYYYALDDRLVRSSELRALDKDLHFWTEAILHYLGLEWQQDITPRLVKKAKPK